MSYAETLRRLMAERGLTIRQVIDATGLHERTVKSVLRGGSKPHARTLHQLAVGLGFDAREFFRPAPAALVVPAGDRAILERAAAAMRGEYRDVLVGMIEMIASADSRPGAETSGIVAAE